MCPASHQRHAGLIYAGIKGLLNVPFEIVLNVSVGNFLCFLFWVVCSVLGQVVSGLRTFSCPFIVRQRGLRFQCLFLHPDLSHWRSQFSSCLVAPQVSCTFLMHRSYSNLASFVVVRAVESSLHFCDSFIKHSCSLSLPHPDKTIRETSNSIIFNIGFEW